MEEPGSPVPPASPTPIPVIVAEGSEPDRGGAGVDRKAQNLMDGLSEFCSGGVTIFMWFVNTGRHLGSRFIAWNRADRRNVGITALSVAVLALGYIAYNSHGTTAGNPQPPQPATATQIPANTGGMRKHKIAERETLVSIGAQNGVSRDDMIAANLPLIRENTAWCKARPVSGDYLKGILKGTSAKRDSNFCVMFDYNGEELALDTAKVGQIANVPIPAVATNNEN